MKSEEKNVIESLNIEGTDDLLLSVIIDQASDLEHGWREAISNSIDSPMSSFVNLWYNEDRSIISDDGDGVEITDRGKNLLTNMGETSKRRDSSDSIGQFGIGKGQYIAKGRVTVLSKGKALHYNIRDWGIEDGVYITDIENAVEFTSNFNPKWGKHVEEGIEKHDGVGFTVVISHYEDETPDYSWRWNEYEDNIRKRFKYTNLVTGVSVFLNDECISDGFVNDKNLPSKSVVRSEILSKGGNLITGIGHKADGSIDIYSNGVFVKEMNRSGFGGVVITDKNFDLNFARNDIKAGCSIWDEVLDIIDEECLKVCDRVSGSNMNDSAREFLMNKMYENDEIFEKYKDKNILKTSNEDYVSIQKVREREEIGISESNDKAADRLAECYGDIILSKHDKAVKILKKNENLNKFDVKEKANHMGLFDKSEVIPVNELTPLQKTKLGVARRMADKIGIEREIKYGKSTLANAWTDGVREIVITDTATPSTKWIQWAPELYRIMIHEWSHEKSTKEDHPNHGRRFEKEYRKKIDENWNNLSEIIEEIQKEGVRTYKDKL